MARWWRSVFFILFTLALADQARAQTTVVVDDDGAGTAANCNGAETALSSIGAAILAASPGSTILVCPGTYLERVELGGKALTVRSVMGPARTIIDGQALGSVVTFAANESRATILDGFTIRNGLSDLSLQGFDNGGGIRIDGASPTILNNVITGNLACAGGGISVANGSPLIQGNTIINNQQVGCPSGRGGGIYVSFEGSAEIVGNEIRANVINTGRGGGLSLNTSGTPRIERNVITLNRASGGSCAEGGGIELIDGSDATIVGNLIAGNEAECGGGIAWLIPQGQTGPRIVNNTFAANLGGQGSAIFAGGYDGTTEVFNNIIVGAEGQTAIHCDGNVDPTSTPIFRSNDVYSSSGVTYGGICTSRTGVDGNVSVDPMFRDGDYHLRTGSPAIDAGRAATGLPALDHDRDARVSDGDLNGTPMVDMGYDEFTTRDLVVDLGSPNGLWRFGTSAGWSRLHPLTPDAMTSADLDGNGQDDMVFDFGPTFRVWAWMNHSTWMALPVSVFADPMDMTSGDVDGDGRDEVISRLVGGGVLVFGLNRQEVLYSMTASRIVVGNLDGSGGEEVVANVPGSGVELLRHGIWSRLHPLQATQLLVADLDGSGEDDLLLNFVGNGLWIYRNDSTWRHLHSLDVRSMAGGDLNGDGRADLLLDFGAPYGLWTYVNDSFWVALHNFSPENMTVGDLDGGGRSDVAVDFGAFGLWLLRDFSVWQPLNSISPLGMQVGRLR